MSRTIDIRTVATPLPINKIRFADDNHEVYIANMLESYSANHITIGDSTSSRELRITSAEHARDLIKALEKAIELGMLK